MIERHQDYVLRGINVDAGAYADFVIPTDNDAPFALRAVLANEMPSQGNTYDAAQIFQMVIRGYDDRSYMNQNPLNYSDSGQGPGLGLPIYPQITFPSQQSILVRVIDSSGIGITNGVLVFRGTKIYRDGVVFGAQYPPGFTDLNFRYGFQFTLNQGTTMVPYELLFQPLNIQSDADFVARLTSMFLQPGGNNYDPGGTDCILRDQYGKAYSNDWVPAHLLFPTAQVRTGAGPQLVVPDAILYPEIYIQKNGQLLLDIRRTSGSETNTYNIVFHGAKIFSV